ncbi:hypothetical protein [Pontibacter sp. G13]|uniref:hypothetical protein n=1 Tax=Pontibacter sp. G13 TaxID=3074898 RepID=UPI002889CD8D|nr:hypothetical protein [Pontibacter sp. G13]WNJ17221.1 hypothetical protein RJD25_20385 [Pontibacter sp. G13]
MKKLIWLGLMLLLAPTVFAQKALQKKYSFSIVAAPTAGHYWYNSLSNVDPEPMFHPVIRGGIRSGVRLTDYVSVHTGFFAAFQQDAYEYCDQGYCYYTEFDLATWEVPFLLRTQLTPSNISGWSAFAEFGVSLRGVMYMDVYRLYPYSERDWSSTFSAIPFSIGGVFGAGLRYQATEKWGIEFTPTGRILDISTEDEDSFGPEYDLSMQVGFVWYY